MCRVTIEINNRAPTSAVVEVSSRGADCSSSLPQEASCDSYAYYIDGEYYDGEEEIVVPIHGIEDDDEDRKACRRKGQSKQSRLLQERNTTTPHQREILLDPAYKTIQEKYKTYLAHKYDTEDIRASYDDIMTKYAPRLTSSNKKFNTSTTPRRGKREDLHQTSRSPTMLMRKRVM